MTGVRTPRGPLPARVYWTRRAMVLGVALLLMYGVATVLGHFGDGKEPAGAETVAAPTGSATSPPVRKARHTRAAAPTKKAPAKRPRKPTTPKPTLQPQPTGPCDAGDVVMTPQVGRAVGGVPVTVVLSMTTRTSPACLFDVSPDSVVLRLTSGADRIWSSQECPRAIPRQSLVVRNDSPARLAVVWDGRRSDESCSPNREWALPGYYHVQAAALGADPVDVQFQLLRPQPKTITPSPKPKPKDEDKPQG